jgi:hypothetical protein
MCSPRRWRSPFRDHFRATEALAAAEEVVLREVDPAVARDLWVRAARDA